MPGLNLPSYIFYDFRRSRKLSIFIASAARCHPVSLRLTGLRTRFRFEWFSDLERMHSQDQGAIVLLFQYML